MANLPALPSGDKPLLTACPGGICAANSRRSLARSRQVAQAKFMISPPAPHPVLALQPPSSPPRHPPNPQPSLQPPPPAASPALPQAPAPAVRRAPYRAVRGPRPSGTPYDPFFTTTSHSSRRSRCANRGVRFRESRSRRLPHSGALHQCIAPTYPGFKSRFAITRCTSSAVA